MTKDTLIVLALAENISCFDVQPEVKIKIVIAAFLITELDVRLQIGIARNELVGSWCQLYES
ncbi:hypothetical protein D1872_286710 [compost metagenome]